MAHWLFNKSISLQGDKYEEIDLLCFCFYCRRYGMGSEGTINPKT